MGSSAMNVESTFILPGKRQACISAQTRKFSVTRGIPKVQILPGRRREEGEARVSAFGNTLATSQCHWPVAAQDTDASGG